METRSLTRSKSLGRAEKKTYAFGSSTPRELSHLNLPQKYRVVSTGPVPRTRLADALNSSPVRRIPSYKPPPAPKKPVPAKSPAKSPAKRPAASPKRGPPAKAEPAKKKAPATDEMFTIDDLTPNMGAPTEQKAEPKSDQPDPPDHGIANEENRFLESAKENLEKAAAVAEAGIEHVKDKVEDMVESVGEKVHDLLDDDHEGEKESDGTDQEDADLHSQLHDAWKNGEPPADTEEKGSKSPGSPGRDDAGSKTPEGREEGSDHGPVDVDGDSDKGEEQFEIEEQKPEDFETHEAAGIPVNAAEKVHAEEAAETVTVGAVENAPMLESVEEHHDAGAESSTLEKRPDSLDTRSPGDLTSPGEHDGGVPSF